ncbi:hypothetical protein R3W88_008887 [Solanum pinnatisectum]|uniref:Terpene synthase metal-binding domain-containing protein n=1 Tax=Solanum pinnatisectum TaxID=50273 RepID=A0AAV9M9W0_9SOLN|nr:hypothetical protein R3W88_008887 [Solanum pinnatisectum]
MACRYILSVIPTMQTQKLHTLSIKNQIQPETKVSSYKPNIWKYDHLLSLTTQYSKKKYQIEAEKLQEEVISCTFSNSDTSVALLELVDEIDKFGLTNYFDVQTKAALEKTIMCMKNSSSTKEEDLYATALCFRLLRQHGYYASQAMLKELFDSKGIKKMSDIKTLLELLEGWDPNEVKCLPECIQICFKALYDAVEEICAEIDDQQKGCCPSAFPCLKQGWLNFCKAILVEAKWYNKGHIPILEEYLNNGWISSTVPLLSDYVIYGLTNNKITNESSKNFQEIIYHTSVIFRLCSDQGTSTAELERGDVASSIICYMQQENVSEDWKKINCHFNTLSMSHREIAKHVINIARMGHVMYQFGDGFGVQDGKTRHQILINLMEPII